MQLIRILADDLTGALDTAGCFVREGQSLPLIFDAASLPRSGSCALSSETRDVPEDEALARVSAFGMAFDGFEGLAFKKIDSLLRGHVAAEIVRIVRQNRFEAVVLAPALPGLGRVTRNGRQWAKLAGDDEYRMIGPDLASAFARLDIAVHFDLSAPRTSGAPQVFLCDAETDDDLERIADHGRRMGRVLWCGSAGLAEAIAGPVAPIKLAARRVLVICGTRHPVASLQVKRLCRDEPSAVAALPPDYDATAAARIVNARLKANTWAALAADFPDMPATEARRLLDEALRDVMPRLDRPDAVIVMGGDTLAVCNGSLGAYGLAVRGLLARGIAVSEFADGAWAGMPVISKSGAFGSEDTLRKIIEKVQCP
ncbi:MAG: hypothetical protein KIT48_15055 [Pseudolabrys sp.]|nr:hypothetical protein [Pseudolabrys sp.]